MCACTHTHIFSSLLFTLCSSKSNNVGHVVLMVFPSVCVSQEAIKCSTTQAQLEQFEQEVATLKLRHQLDLKVFRSCLHVPCLPLLPANPYWRCGTGAAMAAVTAKIEHVKNMNSPRKQQYESLHGAVIQNTQEIKRTLFN